MVCVQTITFAGNIIDSNIGLSMASEYDPTLKDQTTVSGTLYYYTVFLLLMVSGLYQFLISAIVDTYTIIPINGLSVNPSLYSSVVTLVSDYFIIGFQDCFTGICIAPYCELCIGYSGKSRITA